MVKAMDDSMQDAPSVPPSLASAVGDPVDAYSSANPAAPSRTTPESAERWRIIGRLEGEVGALRQEADSLYVKITELRKVVEKPKGKLERLTALLAFVALIFSLVKFPSEFIWRPPRLYPSGSASSWGIVILAHSIALLHSGPLRARSNRWQEDDRLAVVCESCSLERTASMGL